MAKDNITITPMVTTIFTIYLLIFTITTAMTTTYTFNTLDVSSSLHSTLNVFSPQNQPFFQKQYSQLNLKNHHLTSSDSHCNSLSLQIHPRAYLHTPHPTYKDYISLTKSRLTRDSARANYIISKAEFHLRGITHSEVRPVQLDNLIIADDFQAPVSSGTSQGSGEYFTRVGVGSPLKEYYMVIDTGSDVSWLQCQPCSGCYQQTDPIYAPTSSSTYAPLTCNTRECSNLEVSACRNKACMYQVSYGDGSYTVGDFVTETISFGSSGHVQNIAIGCGHDNEGLFVGAAGLLGLGGGPLSLTSQIKATSFSYCLVDRDSSKSSSLEFNSLKPPNSVTAPLLRNNKVNTFYYIGLNGFSVGGHQIAIPSTLFQMDESGSGGVIVDSGTAVTRLPNQAYTSLRNAFTQLTSHLKPADGFALFDTCYDFSSMSSVRVPTLALHFAGGETLNLPAKNYLIPVDSSGTYCFAFAEGSSTMSIIGNVQQQGIRVHYDLARSQVGFSPNNC